MSSPLPGPQEVSRFAAGKNDLMQTFLQTLREEYLTRLEKARSEIHRKVEILESKKRQQQGQLIKLRGEKKELTSKAAALSETYQDLQVKSTPHYFFANRKVLPARKK